MLSINGESITPCDSINLSDVPLFVNLQSVRAKRSSIRGEVATLASSKLQ